jgi:hypothetical protein
MNDAFYKALDRAIAVANEHESELLAYPGVLAVGAGPERTKGKITGKAAIVVTVRKKLDRDDLERALPDQIDDVSIDVIEQGRPVEAPEILEALARANNVLDKVRETWLNAPGVTGIGIGYKTAQGEMNFNQVALKIFVQKKLPDTELRSRKLREVPKEIDGVVTDVEEMGTLRPTGASGSRDDRRDPLVGGLTVGVNTKPFWYGTLGAIVFDQGTGEELVLSNQHVLDGPPGTEVVQPSPIGLDDSLEIGFQLDFCNPINFFRVDTPNTTVGSVLAGAAVAAAVAAALSDEIDPTRRGQEATIPAPGARTLLERQKVKLHYPELPIPGTNFRIGTAWEYTRHTDAGDQAFAVEEEKINPHALFDKVLLTDKTLYHPGDSVRLLALILPKACAPKQEDPKHTRPLTDAEVRRLIAVDNVTPPNLAVGTTGRRIEAAAAATRRCACERYHVTAILTPTSVDRAFPVVLREPVAAQRQAILTEVVTVLQKLDDKKLTERVYRSLRYGCVYTGELVVTNIPMGPWKHYLYVQTVNTATDDMKPTEAAQIIGGLPVSQNSTPQIDVACGPLVYEDGQFDIELL